MRALATDGSKVTSAYDNALRELRSGDVNSPIAVFDEALAKYEPSLTALGHSRLLMDPAFRALSDIYGAIWEPTQENPRETVRHALTELDRSQLPAPHNTTRS